MAAIELGLFVRAVHVILWDFPLNDGGLFYSLVRNLQTSHYALPSTTTYNSEQIPFAYPPLSFYVAGFLADATSMNLFTVFRVLPLIVSTLTIPAFFLLARSMLASRKAAILAMYSFALLPRSFTWLIMGGGLTRSFGLLFAILALHQLVLMLAHPQRRRHVFLAATFAGLTVLSHVEMAWFLAFTAALFVIATGRDTRTLPNATAVALGAAAIAAPWWITVMARHGLSPFLAAGTTGWIVEPGFVLATLPGEEPFFPVFAALTIVGFVACARERRYLLPGWLIASAVLDPRSFATVASVPMALLAAVAITDVLIPFLDGPVPNVVSLPHRWKYDAASGASSAPPLRLANVLVGLLFIYAAFAATGAAQGALKGLSQDERNSLTWIRENTGERSTFAVVTGRHWSDDRISEWFPALAERKSLATVQGTEWLRETGVRAAEERYDDLQRCGDKPPSCVMAWAAEGGATVDYIYLPVRSNDGAISSSDGTCCGFLRASLVADPHYTLVYDYPGAMIFRALPSR